MSLLANEFKPFGKVFIFPSSKLNGNLTFPPKTIRYKFAEYGIRSSENVSTGAH